METYKMTGLTHADLMAIRAEEAEGLCIIGLVELNEADGTYDVTIVPETES